MIYLDHNATTPPDQAAVEAVRETLTVEWGNPSSIHSVGERARMVVERARDQVATLVGCQAGSVIFTSGGTESCHLALWSCLASDPRRQRIVTSRVEHSAVREVVRAHEARGGAVEWLEVDRCGRVDLEQVTTALSRHDDVALVSVQWANSETGVIQDVAAIGRICRGRGIPFHVDAVQWAGKGAVDLGSLPIDLLSISAHKFYGPKGAGALIAAPSTVVRALLVGGPQERGRRGGTEAVPAIAGLGVAADLASKWLCGEGVRGVLAVAAMRDAFEDRITRAVAGSLVIAGGVTRTFNTSLISFPGLEASALVVALSRRGVCASAGAACSSGSLEPSPALLAMGVAREAAHGAVRFSFGRAADEALANDAADRVISVVGKMALLGGSPP